MTFYEWFKKHGDELNSYADAEYVWNAAIASTKAQEKPVAVLLQKPVETLNIKDVDIPS